ncbi:MAG: hypothetical protein PWQ88_1254 [Candidatus Methanomethylophilaceae archaeon]|nr:hypothetical protein [Candidatus Methanomethylophilaceae archaeon]
MKGFFSFRMDSKAVADRLWVKALVIIAIILLPSTLYLTAVDVDTDSTLLYLMIMWPPVIIGLALFLVIIVQHFFHKRPQSKDLGLTPDSLNFKSLSNVKGRCPRCNGKVFEGDVKCRWCDWEIIEDRLRRPA